MQLRTRRSPVAFVLAGGLIAIFIASWIPIWIVWFENPMEGVGYSRTLWHVAWDLVRPLPENPGFQTTTRSSAFNIVLAAVAFCPGAIAGGLGFLIWRRKERIAVEALIAQSEIGSKVRQYPQYPT